MSDATHAPDYPEPHHPKHRRDDVPVDAVSGSVVDGADVSRVVVEPEPQPVKPTRAKAAAKSRKPAAK